jgi:hypothetical protein
VPASRPYQAVSRWRHDQVGAAFADAGFSALTRTEVAADLAPMTREKHQRSQKTELTNQVKGVGCRPVFYDPAILKPTDDDSPKFHLSAMICAAHGES